MLCLFVCLVVWRLSGGEVKGKNMRVNRLCVCIDVALLIRSALLYV